MIGILFMTLGGIGGILLATMSMPVLLHLFPGALGIILCVMLAFLALAAGASVVSLVIDFINYRARKAGKKLHGRRKAGRI